MPSSPLTASPPRKIPFRAKFAVLFQSYAFRLGHAGFWIGIILTLLFAVQSEAMEWFRFDGNWIVTDGSIQKRVETSSVENDELIYEYHISYTVDDVLYSSKCYGFFWESNDVKNAVEYAENNPKRGRIVGMSMYPFSWPAVFVALFPLIALLAMAWSLRDSRKKLKLLTHAQRIRSPLDRREDTNTTYNEMPIYQFVFLFTINNRAFKAIHRSSNPSYAIEGEEKEIWYLPQAPKQNFLFETISSWSFVSQTGEFEKSKEIWKDLLIPTAGLLLSILVIVFDIL